MSLDRRDILKLAAGASVLAEGPRALAKALAVAPNAASGTLNDVEHVVILMQENRSFDHYFGTLRGVRGFGDPRAIALPSGQPVWAQPDPKVPDAHIAPFRLNSETTSAQVMHSLDHSWKGSHATWKHHDAWIDKKTPLTMGYFTRADIPFYYALADAFTVCDAYHCSIFASTNPNRMFLFSGTNGLAAADPATRETGVMAVSNPITEPNETFDPANDGPHFAGFGWTTYAERLQKAGVSWKVYQEHDNYGDNGLAYFKAFRGADADPALMDQGRGCVAGSTAENAKTSRGEHLVAELAKDAKDGTLPQVSWIVAPYIMCEHPSASPGYGESLTARLIEAVADQPNVWAKTVFILNYDENDGFFDHVPPPIPALNPEQGATTVASDGEDYKGEPVGLGPRVPMIVVSPWTRGGWVNSQVFDHTSVIRFLEARFGVQEPNITPWRRSVCGDLTSCFDFKAAKSGGKAHLPDTSQAMAMVDAASKLSRPAVPAEQLLPKQEPGVRLARALPYRFEANGAVNHGALSLSLVNSGPTGVVFSAWPKGGDPRFYTVGAGKTLQATLPVGAGPYEVALHGPNGWRRVFSGGGSEGLEVQTASDPASGKLALLIRNDGPAREVIVTPGLYPHGPARRHILKRGETLRDTWNVAASHHWYDLIVTAPSHPDFQRRVSGHIETGRPSLSDPALD